MMDTNLFSLRRVKIVSIFMSILVPLHFILILGGISQEILLEIIAFATTEIPFSFLKYIDLLPVTLFIGPLVAYVVFAFRHANNEVVKNAWVRLGGCLGAYFLLMPFVNNFITRYLLENILKYKTPFYALVLSSPLLISTVFRVSALDLLKKAKRALYYCRLVI